MGNMEKEEFARMIEAMSDEEKEMAVDLLPVELCYKRIGKELEKSQARKDAIERLIGVM